MIHFYFFRMQMCSNHCGKHTLMHIWTDQSHFSSFTSHILNLRCCVFYISLQSLFYRVPTPPLLLRWKICLTGSTFCELCLHLMIEEMDVLLEASRLLVFLYPITENKQNKSYDQRRQDTSELLIPLSLVLTSNEEEA